MCRVRQKLDTSNCGYMTSPKAWWADVRTRPDGRYVEKKQASERPVDLGLLRPDVPPAVERQVRALVVAHVELLGASDALLLVEHHLRPLRHPAGRPWDGE